MGHVPGIAVTRGLYSYSLSMCKREGNKSLGKPRRRWEDNIKIYLQETGWVDRPN